jgi:hypothetical protein
MRDPREPLSGPHVGGAWRSVPEDEHTRRAPTCEAERAWKGIEAGTAHTRPPNVRGAGWRTMVVSACLAVAAAILLTLSSEDESQLTFELRGAQNEAGVIEARRGEATVSLSDGSSILAENQTRFSVDLVGSKAALTRLVSGKLHVRIVRQEGTSYRFIAGPYEVRVLGTEFDLTWQPSGAGLTLSLAKGEVRVSGLDGAQHSVAAGQVLQLPAQRTASQATAVEPARGSDAVTRARGTSQVASVASNAAATASGEGGGVAVSGSWAALVTKGQFADVVRDAETLGVDDVLQSRGPSDIEALGQAARYVGKRALSLRAFAALRARNPGSDAGRQASFFMGRLQEEQGNQAEALRWLSTYVAEAPRGVYAAEASGRRLSLTERLRGRTAASSLAREYLDRYPEGAHADMARAILERR